MKKIISIILITLLCSTFVQASFAAEGTEGYIYSTDILAYVNGKAIDSYNIGGRTVVIAEDLDGYGFNVEYNDEIRTLKVISYFTPGNEDSKEIPRGKVGEILGSIYKTDIKVYYNGILIKGYNIGGRTAICLEDLGDTADSPNADYGYSQYLGRSVWYPEDRKICYDSYIKNEDKILGISRVYHRFKDNVIYTFADDFCGRSEFAATPEGEFTGMYTYSPGTGASIYNIKPLYFDNHGQQVKIGLCVANPNNRNDALIFVEDAELVRSMIKTFKNPQKTHDEAMAYFETECTIRQKIENDSYTVLMAEHKTKGLLFVYINKQGGFVTDGFLSEYGDREIKFWFDEADAEYGPNTVKHTVTPFAGPHGATTMQYTVDLDEYDYE